MIGSSAALVSGFAPTPLVQQPHLQQPAIRMGVESM